MMLNRKIMKRRDQRGLTLAETLLVLAIGTVAIVGGTILYLQASGAQKVNETVNNLNALQGQIAQLFSSQSAYPSGAFHADMVTAGIVPSNMVIAGTTPTVRNTWGGNVEFVGTGGGTGYRISFADVPQDACISLLTKLAGGQSQTSLRGFTVVGNGAPNSAANPAVVPPVNVTGAIAACTGEQVNGINFYYR